MRPFWELSLVVKILETTLFHRTLLRRSAEANNCIRTDSRFSIQVGREQCILRKMQLIIAVYIRPF